MERDRVAVVGGKGLFGDTVVAALASKRRFHVQRFFLDDQSATARELNAFKPDMIVLVGGIDQPVPQAILSQMEKGVVIVTLDPGEPTMDFSCQVRQAPATLETVMRTVQAARLMVRGEPEKVTTGGR
ncbi:MAG: hypothetical protein HW388_1075 [Dehalococcoidia bacterium]|nr:hypothetical protein [Dehalococcoidia bacterium]